MIVKTVFKIAGDSGTGMQTWINKITNGNFAFKNFPVYYPTSPTKSYSLHDGKVLSTVDLLKFIPVLKRVHDE